MRRWFLRLAVPLLLMAASWGIIGTEAGTRSLVRWLVSVSNGALIIEEVEGTLFSSLRLAGLQVRGAGWSVGTDQLLWQPGSLRLLPLPQLTVERLVLGNIRVALSEAAAATEEAEEGSGPAVLPLQLEVRELGAGTFTLELADGQVLQFFERLVTSLSLNQHRLQLGGFQVADQEYSLQLHGQLAFSQDLQLDLLGKGELAGYGFKQAKGTFSVTGPLNDPAVSLNLHAPGQIQLQGQVSDLFGDLQWQAKLRATALDLSEFIESCPYIPLELVDAELNGNTSGYAGHVMARGAYDWIDQLQLDTHITADWLGIVFDELRVTRENGSIESHGGKISWARLFDWDADLDIHQLELSPIVEDLDGEISGRLHAAGMVSDAGVEAVFSELALAGQLHGHALQATGEVVVTENGVSGRGLRVLSGELTGAAEVEAGYFSWTDGRWQIHGRLQDFDPVVVDPRLAGQVSGAVSGEGRLDQQGAMGALEIADLSGVLFGERLSGGGYLRFAPGKGIDADLDVRNGSSRLQLKGVMDETLDLDFTVVAAEIGNYLPEAAGRLSLQGRVSGAAGSPVLKVAGEGQGVRWADWQVAAFKVHLLPETGGQGGQQGTVELAGLQWQRQWLGDLQLELSGTPEEHKARLKVSHAEGWLSLAVQGGSYTAAGWQGELVDLQAGWRDKLTLQQEGGMAFAVSSLGGRFGRLCLREQTARLCAGGELSWDQGLRWKTSGALNNLNLSLVNRLGLLELPVTGEASVVFNLRQDEGGPVLGTVQTILRQIIVGLEALDEELTGYQIEQTSLNLELGSSASTAGLSLTSQGGALSLAINSQPLVFSEGWLQRLSLDGLATLRELDMGLLSAFTRQALDIKGKAKGDFAISGNVLSPEVNGRFLLPGGRLAIAELGISLQEPELFFNTEGGRLNIEARVNSGGGSLQVQGDLDLQAPGESLSFQVAGKDFLLVDLPEYTLRANPQLKLLVEDRRLQISGEVEVPSGRVDVAEISDKITESQDVAFVDVKAEENSRNLPVDLDVEVRLPAGVDIDGYGLDGKVAGGLRLKSDPRRGLLGFGRLELKKGSFQYYGTNLEIERGRVAFNGGPIGNPMVDILAKKEVEGERLQARNIMVGVTINGLLQDLRFGLFSDPYMEDSLILSYLAVGQSVNSEGKRVNQLFNPTDVSVGLQGDAGMNSDSRSVFGREPYRNIADDRSDSTSLAVGKQLTKKLQVSYNVNMSNQQGQFRIRYELSRGFYLETTSSTESSGADLLYIFER